MQSMKECNRKSNKSCCIYYVCYDPNEEKKKGAKQLKILIYAIVLFIIVIIVGTICYRYLFSLTWIDAFYNASLIMATLDLEVAGRTVAQKLFIVVYALFSVVILLSITNMAVQSIFNRFT